MKETAARPLITGASTLYASAMVASKDIRGITRPKSACQFCISVIYILTKLTITFGIMKVTLNA